VAPPRWGIAIGELAIGGHRGAVVEHRRGKGRERGREWASLVLLGRVELARTRERERSMGASGLRARPVGPSGRKKKRGAARVAGFCFSFSKKCE
jgi:hypothetical protein